MNTLIIATLVLLQILGLCFALYLFTRSISSISRREVATLARTFFAICLVCFLLPYALRAAPVLFLCFGILVPFPFFFGF